MGTWLIEWGLILLTTWTGMPRASSPRPLTFEDRVRAQEAIERVYYEHRIWPKENPGPKPPFEQMISRAQIEAKVEDTLKKSVALDKFWQRPVQPDQLQAEMDRMAKQTQDPETLKEIFAALDNDPYLIAECLARSVLADRLIRNWYAYDTRFHKEAQEKAERVLKELTANSCTVKRSESASRIRYVSNEESALSLDKLKRSLAPGQTIQLLDKKHFNEANSAAKNRAWKLEETEGSFQVSNVNRVQSNSLDAEVFSFPKTQFAQWLSSIPYRSDEFSAVNTNAGQVFIFPEEFSTFDSTGEGAWRASSMSNAVDPRAGHTAIWTGTEMIIWGGSIDSDYLDNIGYRYNPSTDAWMPVAVNSSCLSPSNLHTAIWTGEEMIVWGGIHYESGSFYYLNSGARYNPFTDSWLPLPTDGYCPIGRADHTAVWTGSEMIVWGGRNDPTGWDTIYLNSGGRYSPATNSWIATSELNCPSPRLDHTAVWTGAEMIIWGGRFFDGASHFLSTGGRYDPIANVWIPTSISNDCPLPRIGHIAIWTGLEMIIWGGMYYDPTLIFSNAGSRYNPSTDSWTPTSIGNNCPAPRWLHSAVWTGIEIIIWGGRYGDYPNYEYLNSGARYAPATDSWIAMSTGTNCPSSRTNHTVVWTGEEMIVWGGYRDSHDGSPYLNTGARYKPNVDSWVPTNIGGDCPSPRGGHSAIWTGAEMIIWGGSDNTGGRYFPAIDAWVPTSIGDPCPSGYIWGHSAVWNGTEMIVWSGEDSSYYTGIGGIGGRYNPIIDSWSSTSTGANSPCSRHDHSALWTGVEMIIWGGWEIRNLTAVEHNDGAKYNPSSNSWMPISSAANTPSPRMGHSAIWTGTEMVIWGASDDFSGGRYNPATDSWLPTSTGAHCPAVEGGYAIVWTGREMIIWGGMDDNYASHFQGSKYDPISDTWTSISSGTNCPSSRSYMTGVWTGSEMIVWGGGIYSNWEWSLLLNTGGIYDPRTDNWQRTSTGPNCPLGRVGHTAVWTGKEMIVWGGFGGVGSGGIYRPYSPHERPVEKP